MKLLKLKFILLSLKIKCNWVSCIFSGNLILELNGENLVESEMCRHLLFSPCVLSRFSRVRLFATLYPLSVGFSRQKCWSGLSCLPPGDLSERRIEPVSLMSPALAGRFFTSSATGKAPSVSQLMCLSCSHSFLLTRKSLVSSTRLKSGKPLNPQASLF